MTGIWQWLVSRRTDNRMAGLSPVIEREGEGVSTAFGGVAQLFGK